MQRTQAGPAAPGPLTPGRMTAADLMVALKLYERMRKHGDAADAVSGKADVAKPPEPAREPANITSLTSKTGRSDGA